jgi:hypothetical protein
LQAVNDLRQSGTVIDHAIAGAIALVSWIGETLEWWQRPWDVNPSCTARDTCVRCMNN